MTEPFGAIGPAFAIRDGIELTAAEAIGPLASGCRVFTMGTFPPLAVLEHVLGEVGLADVSICTWTPGRRAFEQAAVWRAGPIRRLRLLTDRSLASRNPAYHSTLTALYGPEAVAFARLHAKFLTVKSVDRRWSLSVLTSANFDEVRSLEHYLVVEDVALTAHLVGFENRKQ